MAALDDGKEHAKHFDRKSDADRWLSLVTADLHRGVYVDPRLSKQTFGAYAERCASSASASAGTSATMSPSE